MLQLNEKKMMLLRSYLEYLKEKHLHNFTGLVIYNKDFQRSQDYSDIKDTFSFNHADITHHAKYGQQRTVEVSKD